MNTVRKILIIIGIIVIILGLLWPMFGKIPLGRLPGDIVVQRPGLQFFFPITSMILLSIIISVILWIIKK